MFKLLRYIYINILKKIEYYFFVRKFRKKNIHNNTFPATFFELDCVSIGKHTYGTLIIKSYSKNAGEKLIIGNYVSISDDVKFILGGNHQMNSITTFPLKTFLTKSDHHLDATSKGPIIIEDEVWFGTNVIVLSGVKIGKGSIIGAGSVITKDVPPYSIVGGNPSRVLKQRFCDDIRQALIEFDISNLIESSIIDNIDDFYCDLDLSKLEEIKNKCSK